MSQFNSRYRLFFKKLTNPSGMSISSPELRIRNFRLERDLLKKASSSFTVLNIPSAIENGDIVGMYDEYGTILYMGIVESMLDSTINTQQIYEIFDDSWLWHNPRKTTLEATLIDIINTDYQNSYDTLLNTIYGDYTLNAISSTNQKLQSQEDRYVTNFASFLYDVYEKYNILLLFDIPFEAETPTINIGKPAYNKLTISNNVAIFRNFTINRNVYETNKLVIYSEETGAYRETWYGSKDGITDNPSSLSRFQKIKTNIIFSDDDINILKASSLRNQMYNHEISCELILNNKLLKFEDLHLGQEVDLFYNGDYYNTILTGYSLECQENAEIEMITLKFGLVRTSLTSKLYKRKYGANNQW